MINNKKRFYYNDKEKLIVLNKFISNDVFKNVNQIITKNDTGTNQIVYIKQIYSIINEIDHQC